MKRSTAILMTLLSPGLVFVALLMCCALMPQCHGETHCHEMEGFTVSGSCCSLPDAGSSGVTLHTSHFTLAVPETPATPAPVSTPVAYSFETHNSTPLDSSPPVLSLRI